MWVESELLKEIDLYYDEITLEQFLLDLAKVNCLDLIEDTEQTTTDV
ncbi:hypothetical protein [Sporosarcina koreensis]|uniref:Uncharacterized protein n=1 Tax=Sporosarcina koreensis TaxID=334735 RepID=A0ABW0U0G6_9BACL